MRRFVGNLAPDSISERKEAESSTRGESSRSESPAFARQFLSDLPNVSAML